MHRKQDAYDFSCLIMYNRVRSMPTRVLCMLAFISCQ